MLIDNQKKYDQTLDVDTSSTASTIKAIMGKENERCGELDMVTGFFTIRGLNFIQEVMSDDTVFRMVLAKIAGVPQDKDGQCAIDLLSEDNGIEAMLTLSEDAQKAVDFLSSDKVTIRAITEAFCHAKSYIFKDNKQPAFDSYITGSSNLTESGLGLIPTHNIELNVAEMGHTETFNAHKQWFNELWSSLQGNETIPSDPNDATSHRIPIKQYFVNLIKDTILKTYTPEDIYYKILFEYFKSEIEVDSAEQEKDINLLQNTVIYKDTLFDYQQKGVISLIKMIEKYNGAILADAVGLGKTFSALAVMWYFQNKGYTVAVFCPKKLQQNWEQYLEFAGSRFEKDRFHYIVNFHTDLQGERLANKTKGSLSYLQNQNKLLVVIDESHNLRNDKSERYRQLLEDIIQVDDDRRIVKVLQLSATPINNRLTDIRNHFNLIGHGRNDAFNKEFGVGSLVALFTDAQRKYKVWTMDPNRTVGGLIQKLPTRFFDLTDHLIVARTRKMVEQTTQNNLGFPVQREPDNIYLGIKELGNYHSFGEIYSALLASNLTAYKPSMYMGDVNEGDWQDDSYREASLVRMMATLFTKRLESSWYACLTTIEKVLKVHEETLKRVDFFLKNKPASATLGIDTEGIFDDDNEEDDDAEEIVTSLDKNRINLAEMKEIVQFKADLEHDVKCLKSFYDNICLYRDKYDAGLTKDEKLEKIKEHIFKKQNSDGNKKLVIFTAFADTAEYLYRSLSKDDFLRPKMACVTGQKTHTPEGVTSKFGEVLQRFAPMSKLYKEKDWSNHYALLDDAFWAEHYDNEKQKWNVGFDEWMLLLPQISPVDAKLIDSEIDILITTDCLSEGQNLQDADLVVNYDIHWNPVRLIQRFGRIDRIGSENATIGSINFWPASDYDTVLNLASRINDRMAAMAIVGSETLPVNQKIKEMMADNPIIDENTQKLLEQMQNNISDIEQPQTVTLANLSLETFRRDLLDYLNKNKDFFQRMPIGSYSGFRTNEGDTIPESLVALVGYPHRKPNECDNRYEHLYLICQPADEASPSTVEEVNVAEILDFLRNNKEQPTSFPEWLARPKKANVGRLSLILKQWMKKQLPIVGVQMSKDRLMRKGTTPSEQGSNAPLLEDQFKFENFDLIVWEYIYNSKTNNK